MILAHSRIMHIRTMAFSSFEGTSKKIFMLVSSYVLLIFMAECLENWLRISRFYVQAPAKVVSCPHQQDILPHMSYLTQARMGTSSSGMWTSGPQWHRLWVSPVYMDSSTAGRWKAQVAKFSAVYTRRDRVWPTPYLLTSWVTFRNAFTKY